MKKFDEKIHITHEEPTLPEAEVVITELQALDGALSNGNSGQSSRNILLMIKAAQKTSDPDFLDKIKSNIIPISQEIIKRCRNATSKTVEDVQADVFKNIFSLFKLPEYQLKNPQINNNFKKLEQVK